MQASDNKITRSYQQEEIQEILQIAIARQAYDGEFSRDQLLEIASELAISPESLQVAEQQWLSQRGEIQKRQEFNIYRRGKLQKQAGNFVIVNSFFVLLNLVNAGELSWSLYVVLFWGLGLGIKAWNTYQSQGEDYERAFERWYRKHQLKQSISTFWTKLMNTSPDSDRG